jgi:hypothetical protein
MRLPRESTRRSVLGFPAMATRRVPSERPLLKALSALLHAPPPMAGGGLEAWQEWGVSYRAWYEEVRNPLVDRLEVPVEPDPPEGPPN